MVELLGSWKDFPRSKVSYFGGTPPCFSRKLEFYSLACSCCSCYIDAKMACRCFGASMGCPVVLFFFSPTSISNLELSTHKWNTRKKSAISWETESQGLLCGWRWRPHLCAVGFILEWCCPGLHPPRINMALGTLKIGAKRVDVFPFPKRVFSASSR